MSSVDQTAAPAKPQHGSRCPVCNNGVLYVIAITEDGELLRCFNCDSQATVPREGEWQHLVDSADAGPTGFQLTPDQLAAKREAGVEPYGTHDHPAFAGAGSPAAPATADTQDEVEPHEQHDVIPPNGGGGDNG